MKGEGDHPERSGAAGDGGAWGAVPCAGGRHAGLAPGPTTTRPHVLGAAANGRAGRD